MASPRIEIRFRGDGGPKYKGPERRGVKYGGSAEDRVAGQIHRFLKKQLPFLLDGKNDGKPVVAFRDNNGKREIGTDRRAFRKAVMESALDTAMAHLGDDYVSIERLPPQRTERRRSR